MSWSYRKHLSANRGYADEKLSECPERVIRLTFDQWLTFYHGDLEHWTDFKNSEYIRMTDRNSYHLPMYTKITPQKIRHNTIDGIKEDITEHKTYIYIKFLTRSDFRKYRKYMKKLTIVGEDFENLCKIEELARYIEEIADKRLRETQQRTQKAIDDNQKLIEETRLKIKAEMSGGKQVELSF